MSALFTTRERESDTHYSPGVKVNRSGNGGKEHATRNKATEHTLVCSCKRNVDDATGWKKERERKEERERTGETQRKSVQVGDSAGSRVHSLTREKRTKVGKNWRGLTFPTGYPVLARRLLTYGLILNFQRV